MRAPRSGARSSVSIAFVRPGALARSNQAESRVSAPAWRCALPHSAQASKTRHHACLAPYPRRKRRPSRTRGDGSAADALVSLTARSRFGKKKSGSEAAARMRVYSSVQNSISRRHRPSSSPCRSEGTSEVCTSSAEPEAHEMIASPAGLPSKPDGARARWSPLCFSAYPHRARPKCPRPLDPVLCFEKT